MHVYWHLHCQYIHETAREDATTRLFKVLKFSMRGIANEMCALNSKTAT
jgi:hypothetical protein